MLHSDQRRFRLAALSPAFLLLGVVALVPLVQVIVLSFQNRSLRYASYKFVGFANFVRLGSDRRFWNAIRVSLTWEAITVVGTIAVAVFLAVYMFEYLSKRQKSVASIALVIPALVPRVSAAYIWKFMYSPLLGIINYFLGLFHVGPVEFLSDPSTALASIAIVDIWQWGLLFGVLVLKVLETMPRGFIEAGRIDGAGRWQLYRYIVVPNLLPVLLSLAFVKMVESLRSFDLIYIMTRGGPGTSTETLDMYAYLQGISIAGRISYAAAASLAMLVATILFFTLLWRQSERWYRA